MAEMETVVNESMDLEVDEAADVNYEATYQMIGDARIPVSKHYGPLWKSRKRASLKRLEENGDLDRWADAIKYYRNDHSRTSHSDSDGEVGRSATMNITTTGVETENIVFANATALLPAVYAKEPNVTITPETRISNEDLAALGTAAERLIKKIFTTRSAPGINLKRTMRKAALLTLLTNYAYIQVGYTKKEESSGSHLEKLSAAMKKFQDAKDMKEIKEAEGELMAAEQAIDILDPEGPYIKLFPAGHVLFDPDANDRIHDSNWIMIKDYLHTDFLRSTYGSKDENDKAHWKSRYEPTHVLRIAEEDELEDNLSVFNNQRSYKDYGFEDELSYHKAQRTCVWYVYDKVTRRIFLYNDCDWTYPLWVWDDPYQLPNFFNVVEVSFYEDPLNQNGRSEVNMYLDHQDAINEINNEFAKARKFISGKIIYNKNVLKDPALIDALVAGTSNKTSVGIDAPIDSDLTKLIFPLMPPSAAALNTGVMDKQRAMQAIDRVSSVTAVLQGVEFKTNTTNKAIESYQSSTQTRLDEKIDAIEDAIGQIGEIILWFAAKFMPDDMISSLLDEADAAVFIEGKHIIGSKFNSFPVRVVGGSTQKPTSAVKKQQAMQLTQVVGQFASAAPAAVIVILRMLQRAFDDFSITKEDWDFIMESIQQQMQRGNNSPTGGAPQQGQPPAGENGGPTPEQAEQLKALIESMPPEAQEAIGQLMESGMPAIDAVETVAEEMGL